MDDKKTPESEDARMGMTMEDYEIHQEARIRFDNLIQSVRQEREQCRDDRRFYAVSGAQWEGDLGDQYENKARIEVNKTHISIIKIQAAQRENPITCDFVSREGKETDALAQVCDGLYRSDEQDSTAQEAYDNAFEEAVSGGFGAFRLRTAWEDPYDEDDDRQRIEFDPIFDADQRVFFDPHAQRQNKGDAMFAFLLTPYSKEAYRLEFDDDVSSWPEGLYKTYHFDWVVDDAVYVAEYFRVEEENVKFCWYRDVGGDEKKYEEEYVTDEMKREFKAIKTVKVREKTIKRRVVRKYLMSGGKVLNAGGELIAGPHIPIVPCYGKRIVVDNIERCIGHVRLAKDIQRVKNMVTSQLAEIAAKSPIRKPIFYPEQTAGHEDHWENDVTEDYPYLHINPMYDKDDNMIPTGPIAYTQSPDIPPVMGALLQLVDVDLRDILGNQDQGEEIRSNISGDVVQQIHAKLDMQEFIYISNHAKSIQRGGEIWLGMAREVYSDDGRTMKSVNRQGETNSIIINRPVIGKDGQVTSDTDIANAKFNVYTNVAPTSASRKAATVRNITNMLRAGQGDPESTLVMNLMAMMNSEGEGMEHLRDYASLRLARMGVIKPSDEQAEKMKEEDERKSNAPPDPNTQYLQAEAAKAEAQTREADQRRMKSIADTRKVEVEALAKLTELPPEDRAQVLEIFAKMQAVGFTSLEQPQASQRGDPQQQEQQN